MIERTAPGARRGAPVGACAGRARVSRLGARPAPLTVLAMPLARGLPPPVASRRHGIPRRRLLTAFRALSLILLFLLPMQMRAGADDPHPHAMLQLLFDAR